MYLIAIMFVPLYWHCHKPAAVFVPHHDTAGCSIPAASVVKGSHLQAKLHVKITDFPLPHY